MCSFDISCASQTLSPVSFLTLALMSPQIPLQVTQGEAQLTQGDTQVTQGDIQVTQVETHGAHPTDPLPVTPEGARDDGEEDIEDRINDILTTLNSLTAELSGLSTRCRTRPPRRGVTRAPSILRPVVPTFEENRGSSDQVLLDVGGKQFPFSWVLLARVPDSRLGRLAQARTEAELLAYCDSYDVHSNTVFFQHRHKNFSDILEYYRTGSMHISSDLCPVSFMSDLLYWALPQGVLEPCCLKKYVDLREQLDWEEQKVEVEEDEFPPGTHPLQQQMWDLFERPHTSMMARVVGVISVSCIFISTIILTLDTMPYFHNHPNKIAGEFAAFVVIEAVYMAWFTLEFIVRVICCPNKCQFMRRTMNWIDLLAIVPYFVTVTLNSYGVMEEDGVVEGLRSQQMEQLEMAGEDAGTGDVSRTAQYFRLLKVARIVKTLRIIRIFKLARHSTGLQALGNTMKSNYKELGLLFLLLGMGAIMFASLVYVFEKEDPKSTFKTMFDSYWWAIITMTTVGYGDVSPTTGSGKVLGCFCAIFGVLVIGLPIPIIGNSFNKFYARQRRWEKKESLAASQRSRSQKLSTVSTLNNIDVEKENETTFGRGL